MSRSVAVVAHTHWDREWYSTFETYRTRLTSVMDDLLTRLESDPAFLHFHLDGQTAMVDDYLAVRPGQAGRLARLVRDGRLSIGPWYVLMDEFCVSGETIIRNLQRGLSRVAEIAGTAPAPAVGYLPDMFGHIAQMPQLLRLAGIDHAVVWRGVPRDVAATAFHWDAPDGSRVRAEFLPVGYANGAFLPKDPAALVRRIRAHETELAGCLGPGVPMLLMNGGDHQFAQGWMPDLLAGANDLQDDFHFAQTSLADYLLGAAADDLTTWTGELRSGARSNILMGVLSNRADVKMAAAAAERSLEKLAEPLAAIWLPPELWPADRLDQAWLAAIRNSAHDSICACSVDPVGRAVLQRYDQVASLTAGIIGEAVAIAEVATTHAGPLVLNPSSRRRSGVVEVVLPGSGDGPDGQDADRQVVACTPAGIETRAGTGADLARLLGELARDGWLGPSGRGVDAECREGPDGVEIRVREDACARAEPTMAATMAEAWAIAGARRSDPLVVRVDRAASHRALIRVAGVPGYGWRGWTGQRLDVPPVAVSSREASNGMVTLAVDEITGTFAIDGHRGLGLLVDDGDDGDTYNYSAPASDVRVSEPLSTEVHLVESGPLRARFAVRRTYDWPAAIAAGQRSGSEAVEVETILELRAGERMVRMATRLDNRSRDHRLRLHFPLPAVATESLAECAFGLAARGEAEGGPHELALATYPSRRFVSAGGLTVTHDGLLEYEVVDQGRTLALTLLRCVGVLSKPAPAFRPNAAGPAEPVADAQMPGRHTLRCAVAVGAGDPWALAEDAWVPLIAARSTGTGHLPPSGSRLRVEGAEVSSLRRHGQHFEIRVFNPNRAATVVRIDGHRGRLVDLRGEPGAVWDGRFDLGSWAIATARLDALSLD